MDRTISEFLSKCELVFSCLQENEQEKGDEEEKREEENK